MSSNFPSHWKTLPFEIAVADVTAGKTKLQGSEYSKSGVLPIIDQGQEFIGGYTDDINYQANVTLPTIIFGDHTRVFKYVDFPFCLGADGTKILEPKVNLDKKFLFHYLKSLNISSAGYSRHYKFLKENVVPIPPLEEQKRIAAILDKADAIRRKRQQSIKLAEEYLRAVFLDMFGDPVTNPKAWKVKPIGEICTIVRGSSPRPQGDPKYYGGPIPRLMVADLTRDGKWVTPKIDNLTLEGAKKSRPINAGTVVMAVSGNVGLTAILEIDACIHDGFIAFNNLKTESVEPEFLYEVMMFLKTTHASRQAGAIFQNITTSQIKEMLIPLPSIDMQKKYLTYVQQLKVFTDKQHKFLDKDNDLFCSLSNNAFSGNLN